MHDHLLEELSVEDVGLAVVDRLNSSRPLIVIEKCKFSETGTSSQMLVKDLMLVDIWIVWIGSFLVNNDLDVSFGQDVVQLASVTELNDRLTGLEGLCFHRSGDLVNFFFIQRFRQEVRLEERHDLLQLLLRLLEDRNLIDIHCTQVNSLEHA